MADPKNGDGNSGDYDLDDAAKDTDSGSRETARAWHAAREDAQEAGELREREERKEVQEAARQVEEKWSEDNCDE